MLWKLIDVFVDECHIMTKNASVVVMANFHCLDKFPVAVVVVQDGC